MHPMANSHKPSTYSIRPCIYVFLEHLIHQQHLYPFLPLTQTMGVANPFPFCCPREEVLKTPTSWIRSQNKRKGLLQLFISHMPLPFAFFGLAPETTRIKRKTYRFALFCNFWKPLNVTLRATFHFVRLFPKSRLQFLFDSHILRTTAPLFKLPCLWECYLISGLAFNIEQSQKRITLLFKM